MKNRKRGPVKLELPKIIEIYRRMLDVEPSSTIFLPLAEAYRKNGELGKAAEMLQKGLVRMPDYWGARLALVLVYYEMGRFDEARREVDLVIENRPDNIVAHRLSGLIYKESGKSLEAAIEFKRVLAMRPDDEQSASALKDLIRGGFVDEDAVTAIGEMAFGSPARGLKAPIFEELSSSTIDGLGSERALREEEIGGYAETCGATDEGGEAKFGLEPGGECGAGAKAGSQVGTEAGARDEPVAGGVSDLDNTVEKLELWLDELRRKKGRHD